MKQLLQRKGFLLSTVILLLYLVFNGILLAGHELWRDEANVWLIARDMGPLQLFREIKYQGHPCLWYLIAMPFAKLGFPFQTLSVLSFLVMTVAAGLFAYCAPFHPITKTVCLLSPMFTYYYPVVARNYCLIAVLLILLAQFYPKRNKYSLLYGILLGLLVQGDTIALATAGLISCMWLWECVRDSIKAKSKESFMNCLKGIWIPLASLCLWVLQFYRVSDSPEYQFKTFGIRELIYEIRNFSYHILTRMTGQSENFDLLLIIMFMVSGILAIVVVRNAWPVIVMIGSFLFEVLFSIWVYQLHIWHYIALCFALIWCFWASNSMFKEHENTGEIVYRISKVLAEILLVLMGITMFIRWNAPEESSSLGNAWSGVYSDGVYAAEYIRKNLDEDELFVSTDVVEAATVQAYLGKKYRFYFAGNQEALTYANYTEDEKTEISYEELISWIQRDFPEKEYFYLLICATNYVSDIPAETKEDWTICYQTVGNTARGEEYTIVKVELP